MIKWLIEEIHDHNGLAQLAAQLKELGRTVSFVKYQPFSEGVHHNWLPTDDVIVVGSINLCQQLSKEVPSWNKGIWATFENYDCLKYLPKLKELCLNYPYEVVQLTEIWDKRWALTSFTEDSCLFIRPNEGTKDFTGSVIDYQNLEAQLKVWQSRSSPNCTCIVSKPQKLKAEWRIIVAAVPTPRVVASSLYRLDGNATYVQGSPKEAQELALLTTKLMTAPDPLYIVDVAQTPQGLKIVELNAFSSAAQYACNSKETILAAEEAYKTL